MLHRLLIILTIFLSSTCLAQSSRALLVGVQEYPKNSGWSSIHAKNDLRIVSKTIREAGFKDIRILRDAQATHSGIVSYLQRLSRDVNAGDRVLVFFSCHGQLITDTNADETSFNPRDKYDEALIPYDAQIAYNWNNKGYKGENHLTDDELNLLLGKIKDAVGETGQLVVLLDACHSGDMERSESKSEKALRRGVKEPFRLPKTASNRTVQPGEVSWVSISACRDFQNNYECVIDGTAYGRLAYSFSQVYKPGINSIELVNGIKGLYETLPTSSDEPRQQLHWYIPKGTEQDILFR